MDQEEALRSLANDDDLSQATVLRKVVDKLGGLEKFAGMVAQDYIEAQPASNARARIGTTLLQALLRHGEDEGTESEDLESLEAELQGILSK